MNTTFLGVAMLCVLGIVIAASIALVTLLLKPAHSKQKLAQRTLPDRVSSTPAFKNRRGWILPVIIAIALAFWSVIFALFFLAVVWVIHLNPKTDSKEIPFPSDKDRKRAKGTYTWLLLSSPLNVIIFAIGVINLGSRSSANERVITALIPLLIHLPVLIRLDNKSPFVFRHTQQAIFLLALRASMATLALNISKYPEDGFWLFVFGNGFLWLVGSFWGRGQAHRGTGWWINRKGEKVLAADAIPVEKTTERTKSEELFKSLNGEGSTARQKALNAFRTGTPETRKKAVLILSELGEVERF
jgi:hypothetical protein